MSDGFKSLNCPNCGSYEITLLSENVAQCNSCGSKFSVAQNGQNNIFVTNTYVTGGAAPCVTDTVRNDVDTIEFTRRAALGLAFDSQVPADVFDADFQPAFTEKEQFFAAYYDVDTAYSVSVGTNRTVTSSRYNPSTKRYETVSQPVVEWSPVTGNHKCTEAGVITLKTSSDANVQAQRFRELLNDPSVFIPFEAGTAVDTPVTPTPADYREAKREAEKAAQKDCENSVPGTVRKDFRASSISSVQSTIVALVPDHVLRYDYNGRTYEIREFACSERIFAADKPKSASSAPDKINKLANTLKYASLAAYVLFMFIALCLFGTGTGASLGIGIPVILLATGLYFFRGLYLKKAAAKEASSLSAKKISSLETFLSDRSVQPLTASEKDGVKKTVEKGCDPKDNLRQPKVVKVLCVLTVVLVVLAIIF